MRGHRIDAGRDHSRTSLGNRRGLFRFRPDPPRSVVVVPGTTTTVDSLRRRIRRSVCDLRQCIVEVPECHEHEQQRNRAESCCCDVGDTDVRRLSDHAAEDRSDGGGANADHPKRGDDAAEQRLGCDRLPDRLPPER